MTFSITPLSITFSKKLTIMTFSKTTPSIHIFIITMLSIMTFKLIVTLSTNGSQHNGS